MIKEIDFYEILDIWTNHLWPNRTSKILPTSPIQCDLSYDTSIFNYTPVYFGYFEDDNIIGVNSGFKTANGYFRSRGLFVFPEYRRNGISRQLLSAVEDRAVEEDCKIVWTLPRLDAMIAYERAGYTGITEFFTDKMEYGPNCVAIKYVG